jgi:ribosomal protein S18 acetylase RimI-like enzyme
MIEFLDFRHFRSLVNLAHLYTWAFNFTQALEKNFSDSTEQTMTRIIQAQTEDHYRRARRLFQQYADALGVDLEFQGFSRELATLPGAYAPPKGCILLAESAEEIVGCVALRPLENLICEMKRLYVVPGYRNRKIGRALAEAVIEQACTSGYERMRLDTLESMTAAQTLYHSLGFRPIKPYRFNPLHNPSYFELNLLQ